jgi:hypothetical protein
VLLEGKQSCKHCQLKPDQRTWLVSDADGQVILRKTAMQKLQWTVHFSNLIHHTTMSHTMTTQAVTKTMKTFFTLPKNQKQRRITK